MITYVNEKDPILYATPIYISAAVRACKHQWKKTHLCRLVQFIKRKGKKTGQVLKAGLEQIKKSRAKDWGFVDPLLLGVTHTFTSKVLLHLHFSDCKKELAIYSEKNLTIFS